MSSLKNSLVSTFPGLALLLPSEPSQVHESNKAELTERQKRLEDVVLKGLNKLNQTGQLPIPGNMAAGVLSGAIRELSDDQIEEYCIAILEEVEWVLSGPN
mgnify:CR=1 FL=1